MDISALMEKGRFLGLREVERENTRIQSAQTLGYMSFVASRITLVFVIDEVYWCFLPFGIRTTLSIRQHLSFSAIHALSGGCEVPVVLKLPLLLGIAVPLRTLVARDRFVNVS